MNPVIEAALKEAAKARDEKRQPFDIYCTPDERDAVVKDIGWPWDTQPRDIRLVLYGVTVRVIDVGVPA